MTTKKNLLKKNDNLPQKIKLALNAANAAVSIYLVVRDWRELNKQD